MQPAPANSLTRGQVFTLLAAFLGWMFDGLEMGIFPLVARPALTEMLGAGLDEGQIQLWTGYVTCAFLLGAAAGGLVFGWLGDRLGRVRAMILSVLAYSIFTGLNYFAHEPWHLALFRFIAALGMGGEWSLGVALVMEAWPRDRRPLLAGVIGAAANLGYAAIALLSLFYHITVDSWRWVMLVGAAPALLTLLISRHVPESTPWKEAVRAGGESNNPLAEIFGRALRKKTILAILFSSVALIVTWCIVQWLPVWADKLTEGKQPQVKSAVQLASSIGAMLGSLSAPLLGGWIGRRPAYTVLCLTSFAACTALFRGWHEFSPGFVAMSCLVGACTAAFYGWLPLYLPELFPTRVRATGQGVAFNSGRLLAAVCAWNMGNILAYFGKDYAHAGSAIVTIYLAGAALIWLAPETKGQPLPD